MKKLALMIVIPLIIYSVYYDLQNGTLPNINAEASSDIQVEIPQNLNSYKDVVVKPGDTVLSLVEQLHGKLPVSISTVIEDFKELNDQTNPDKIQIGKSYKIPRY